jgi:hypothetical protein
MIAESAVRGLAPNLLSGQLLPDDPAHCQIFNYFEFN